MEIKISNTKRTLNLADDIFSLEFNEPLVHQIIVARMAAERAGTKAQKTRAEVRGGGTKPWRQKGTGRARAGTIRSPIWRKGGVVFAAKPRSYNQKINKKMYKGALRSILSELIRQDRIIFVEQFQIEDHKTKSLKNKLSEMKVAQKALIISDAVDENLYLAARNLPFTEILDPSVVIADPVALVRAEKVVITEAAIKEMEKLLK